LVFGREPTPEEVGEAHKFLISARESLAGTPMLEDKMYREAWASLMRVLLSSNEFMTLE
jgi:hypothetical protein